MDDKIKQTLEVNERQKAFYNATTKHKNGATRVWSKIRNGVLSNYRNEFDIKNRVYEEHKLWLGPLEDKKVLDLGCLRGNALSLYMAKHAKEYIGIDLSDVAISDLNKKIEQAKCKGAKGLAVDFLSDDFYQKDFHVIYAYGVLHHFEDFDILISKLEEKLKPGGIIISYDPLETSFPVKVARTLYRPFQSDKDWEWPFKKATLKKIESHFVVEERRGILGQSKYGLLLNYLPLSKSYKREVVQNLIEKDWNINSWKDVYSCMHLTMLLRRK